MYIEPKIESSYYFNNKGAKETPNYFYPEIGRTLYGYIIETQPKLILEFGVLHGYSTISMAQALKKLNYGKIHGYDIWEDDKYGHGQTLKKTQNSIDRCGLGDYIKLLSGNIFEVLSSEKIKGVDLVHIDINNDGHKLKQIIKTLKSSNFTGSILFEGGIEARDECWWMKEFNKTPITTLKTSNNYVLLNNNYPGISLIKKLKYEKI